MKHEEYRDLLILDLYDELESDEQEKLREHLSSCLTCRKEKESLLELHAVLDRKPSVPPEEALWQVRRALLDKLSARRNGGRRFADWFSSAHRKDPLAYGAAAAAMLVLGFLGGYWLALSQPASLPEAASQIDPFSDQGIQVSNVRFQETDPVTGEVELSFDAARHFQISGRVTDSRIQKLLAYALVNEQNPGVRLRAVNAIQSDRSQNGMTEVQRALLAAVKTDGNVAVRQRALQLLRQYAFTPEVQETLLYVLKTDENPRLRIEAISSLEQALAEEQEANPNIVDALEDRAQTDTNDYIRLRARAVLKEVLHQ